jgi:hypothetical protein
VRRGGLVLALSILAMTAACSSGNSGIVSGGGGGGVSPGHGSPKAAVDGFVSGLISGGTAWCSYVDPSDQSDCTAGATEAGLTVTGTYQIRNQVVQANEAIVTLTGSLCHSNQGAATTAPSCFTNNNSNAGLPPGAGSFAQAYSAAENNASGYDAIPCIEVNGSWYVNLATNGSTTPTTTPTTTPATTPTTTATSVPGTTATTTPGTTPTTVAP